MHEPDPNSRELRVLLDGSAVLLPGFMLFLAFAGIALAIDTWRLDEAYTDYQTRSGGPGQIIRAAKADVHPPLYYLLLRGWRVAWPHPMGMRAFSLAAAAGAYLLLVWIARRLGGLRAAVRTGLLLAAFPQFIYFAQDARMYSLAVLFEAAAMAGVLLAPRAPAAGWVLAAAASLAAMYTHNLCAVFVALLFVALFALRLIERSKRGAPALPSPDGMPGFAWLASACGAIALGYLPWIPVVLRQSSSDLLQGAFEAPTFTMMSRGLFVSVFAAGTGARPPLLPLGWVPGLMLLLVLPAMTLRRAPASSLPAGSAAQCRLAALPAAAALGSLAFLVCFSLGISPVFEAWRHSALFAPFLLLASGLALGRLARGRWPSVAAGVAAAVFAAATLAAVVRPMDQDFRTLARAVQAEREKSGAPAFAYPYWWMHPMAGLMWSPLAFHPTEKPDDIPEAIPESIVIVLTGAGAERERILDEFRSRVPRPVSEVHLSHEAAAFHVKDSPPGEIRGLLLSEWQPPEQLIRRELAALAPKQIWQGAELHALLSPAPETVPMGGGRAEHRLAAETFTLEIPASAASDSFMALAARLRIVHPENRDFDVSLRPTAGNPWLLPARPGVHLIAAICRAGETPRIEIALPAELSGARTAALGDAPRGLYLDAVCEVPLAPERFRREGAPGLYFAVGDLGDELFIRSGFHVREGAAPNPYRWTKGEFELEVPVWAGINPRTIVLSGIISEDTADRRIEVRAERASSDAPAIAASARDLAPGWAERAIELPEPLGEGVWRLRFKVGTWNPAKAGKGPDPRDLGLYLDGIGLR